MVGGEHCCAFEMKVCGHHLQFIPILICVHSRARAWVRTHLFFLGRCLIHYLHTFVSFYILFRPPRHTHSQCCQSPHSNSFFILEAINKRLKKIVDLEQAHFAPRHSYSARCIPIVMMMMMMVELSLTLVRRLKLIQQSNEVAFHHRIVIVRTPRRKLFYTITSHILIYKLLNIINLFVFFHLFRSFHSLFFGLFVEHCVCVSALLISFLFSVVRSSSCYFRYPIRFEVLRCVYFIANTRFNTIGKSVQYKVFFCSLH